MTSENLECIAQVMWTTFRVVLWCPF